MKLAPISSSEINVLLETFTDVFKVNCTARPSIFKVSKLGQKCLTNIRSAMGNQRAKVCSIRPVPVIHHGRGRFTSYLLISRHFSWGVTSRMCLSKFNNAISVCSFPEQESRISLKRTKQGLKLSVGMDMLSATAILQPWIDNFVSLLK